MKLTKFVKKNMRIVAPSILSANFAALGDDVEMLNSSEAEWIHLDIMDGVFVPNISFGFPVVKSIANLSSKFLDAHLMIVDPDRYTERFAQAGANCITVHYEACKHLNRSVQNIKSMGVKAGVSINPHTPVNVLEEILQYADLVLIMSVNPGFGGQAFIETSVSKVEKLRMMAKKANPDLLIEVDGGVTESNAGKLFKAGADILVAGNSVFGSKDPVKAIHKILHAK
jgi:ribulose-phosphate 3-epimerase